MRGMVKFQGGVVLSLKNPLTHLLLPHFSSKALLISSLAMDPFNTLSTVVAVRMIPPLREASPTKVTSCVLGASTDLEKALDAAEEATGGDDTPSATMAGRPNPLVGQPWLVAARSPSRWVSHHLRARVPLLAKVVVHILFVRFPLIR
jgi:hypothetical protein